MFRLGVAPIGFKTVPITNLYYQRPAVCEEGQSNDGGVVEVLDRFFTDENGQMNCSILNGPHFEFLCSYRDGLLIHYEDTRFWAWHVALRDMDTGFLSKM